MAAGILLTSSDGARYRFDAGTLFLEILLTGGPGPYERFEILHAPADLAAWLPRSRLGAPVRLVPAHLRISPMELREVKRLRDTLHPLARDLAADLPARPEHLRALNDAAGAAPRPRIDPATRARAWELPISGTQVLGALARDAIDVVASARAERVRECAASDCRLLFLDTSRPGSRRWCSMERCGNRHKVAAHRARTRD
ncbi:CGNR zinc finger domain-containing protein [Streptomonospora sp. S1-112]|uniref:CGNR zinc finger domain-containing protein n=1 Tax=Streptomonospora mangrovi TaxID=2883123 RepID=A0A9X3NGP4_9ACTN|nr:CGNR zinc finger domain-containing protein [Streptomonospora mangrovi]MDA0563257.1 CGNR zinc finger domain-containing protein [Streptomonospora mangrovi]